MIKLITANPINNKDRTVYREFNKGNNTLILSIPGSTNSIFSISGNVPDTKVLHIIAESMSDEIYLSNVLITSLPTAGGATLFTTAFLLKGDNELFLSIDPATDNQLFIFAQSTAATRLIMNFYNG